jgi:hypothetical protein
MSDASTALPRGWLAGGLTPVGYCGLEGRPGFKMSVKQAGGRWYLYLGHFWHSGWSVVDVTDPSAAVVAAFLEGPANTATLQVDLAGTVMVTALEKILPGFGGDPDVPFEEGVVIWSLAEATRPEPLGTFRTGGTGTHRNGYPGGRYVHLAANMAGYSRNIYVIIDISDPSAPREVSRWWVPGQHLAGGETPSKDGVSLHGPPVPVGDLVYLPYGSAGVIVLDLSDIRSPRQVGELSFSPPFRSEFSVHSVVPHPERGLAYVNSEGATEHCGQGADHVSVIDIHDPGDLRLISVFPRPEPPSEVPYADFCDRPGWSGPHNQSQLHHNPDVAPQGNLVYLTYFNAGLRVFDVSQPRLPREVAWFLPPDPARRFGPQPPSDLVVQSEDVLVDRRGFIYVTDKNQGLWILRQTEPD